MNNFYTYAYLREDGTPYYIGKGQGNRAWMKGKRITKPPSDKNRILLLKTGLTEEQAFTHEKYMIAIFGRKDLGTGILLNFTDGGEGTSGRVHTFETKQKMSKAHMGKRFSAESREKMSKAKRQMTEETKQKLREAATGFQHSEETKKRISEKQKGRVFSEEHRKKLSEARKRRAK